MFTQSSWGFKSLGFKFKYIGRFLFKKMSVSTFSPDSLFLLSWSMLEAVLNSLSLSTLVEGAQRNFAAVAAREGNRSLFFPQYSNGLSMRWIVLSARYVSICTCVAVLLAPPCSASYSCRTSSYSPLKQLLLLVLGSSIRGALLAGSAASVVVVCSDLNSSFFSTSWVSALFASLLLSALVKYLQ